MIDKNSLLPLEVSIATSIYEKKEFVLSNRPFRYDTSFAELSAAYKEAKETNRWLGILSDMRLLNKKAAVSLFSDSNELLELLGSTLKTMKHSKRVDE